MAVLPVGPNSSLYQSIAAAMVDAVPGDTIELESGYSNETASVTQSGITVTGDGSSVGIVLQLAAGIPTFTLGGNAPIEILDAPDANTLTGNAGGNLITVSAGADVVDGGPGIDRLVVDYQLATGPVTGNATTNFTEAGGGLRSVSIIGGTVENFTVLAGSGADTLTTAGGSDLLSGGPGDDVLDGGGGTGDSAAFSGDRGDYTVTFDAVANAWTVADLRPGSPDGTDTLTGIEIFLFNEISYPAAGFDDVGPAAPANTALAPESDSGAVGDGRTYDTTPTLTGTAEAGTTVTVLVDGAVVGTTTADLAGGFRFTPGTPLTEATHGVTVTATDFVGNVSAPSAPFVVTIDSFAPEPPAGIAIAPGSDSGAVGDGRTYDTTPTLTGTAESGTVVAVLVDGTVVGTTSVDAAGQFSFTPSTPLPDATYSITATATDFVGNLSDPSAPFAVTIDSFAPGAPAAVAIAADSDSGAVGDGLTFDTTPTLTGTAESGATVTVSVDDAVIGTTTADGAGQFSFTPGSALTEGVHSVTATATDFVGNLSGASVPLSITIDSVAPPVTAALAQDTGLGGDGVTSDPTLTGSTDPGGTIVFSEGATVLGQTVADSTGAFRFTPAGLAEGPHAIAARSTDASGNVGAATVSFVLSGSPPTVDYILRDGDGVLSEGSMAPSGPDFPGIVRQFTYAGAENATLLARADNARITMSPGSDAIQAQGGRNVLDGNGGSDWLVGGTGQTSYLVNARGGTWSTLLAFKAGDDVTIRGIAADRSTFRWDGTDGDPGYQGATLRGVVDATGQEFSVTFQGLTVEETTRYAGAIETDAAGTSVLRLRAASAAAPDDATYVITDVTTGVTATGLLDAYSGPIAGLRYQHTEAGDAPVALLAQASDALLATGAGNDALVARNGDNVLSAGAGSNWFVGGAGNDTFQVIADAGQPVWNTVLNFHAGDEVTMQGFVDGLSSWGWTATSDGASGYEGATLRGSLNGQDTDFSLTLAGISVEEARGFAVSFVQTADGVGALSVRA